MRCLCINLVDATESNLFQAFGMDGKVAFGGVGEMEQVSLSGKEMVDNSAINDCSSASSEPSNDAAEKSSGQTDQSTGQHALSQMTESTRKCDGKPRRPLSAYNLFFREQRERIIEERAKLLPAPPEPTVTRSGGRRKKQKAKVPFEELAKLIGARWKNIDPEELLRLKGLAQEDANRYKLEMQEYLQGSEVGETQYGKRRNRTSDQPDEAGSPGRQGSSSTLTSSPATLRAEGFRIAPSGQTQSTLSEQVFGLSPVPSDSSMRPNTHRVQEQVQIVSFRAPLDSSNFHSPLNPSPISGNDFQQQCPLSTLNSVGALNALGARNLSGSLSNVLSLSAYGQQLQSVSNLSAQPHQQTPSNERVQATASSFPGFLDSSGQCNMPNASSSSFPSGSVGEPLNSVQDAENAADFSWMEPRPIAPGSVANGMIEPVSLSAFSNLEEDHNTLQSPERTGMPKDNFDPRFS